MVLHAAVPAHEGSTHAGPTGPRAAAPWPGLLVATLVAAVATVAGRAVPVLGAPVIAIVVGLVCALLLGRRAALRPGVDLAKGPVLQLAVVVLGAQLSLRQVARVGVGSLPVMLGTVAVCLTLAWLLGRRLGVDGDLRTLIGVGTAICGASAIAAVSPVIRAASDRIAYAVSTIFVFNVAAVLVFPPLGHALGLSQHAFGLFAGTAVNDTSSVVATASAYGSSATQYAVVVKLTRTLVIIPICLALAAVTARTTRAARSAVTARAGGAAAAPRTGHERVHPARLVPWFVLGFLAAAGADSAGLVPAASHPALSQVSLFLTTTALAGIGLSTDLAAVRRAGARPLLLGLLLWVAVTATSLLLQWATG